MGQLLVGVGNVMPNNHIQWTVNRTATLCGWPLLIRDVM
jgi:hypothetical protein